jgi:hypothetical protein
MKMGNQWRGLATEEVEYLSEKAKEKRAAEKIVKDQEAQDVAEYREWVTLILLSPLFILLGSCVADSFRRLAGRQSYLPPDTTTASPSLVVPPKRFSSKAKKDVKSLMKGVVVKKKPAAAAPPKPAQSAKKPMTIGEKDDADLAARAESKKRDAEDDEKEGEKKQKIGSAST